MLALKCMKPQQRNQNFECSEAWVVGSNQKLEPKVETRILINAEINECSFQPYVLFTASWYSLIWYALLLSGYIELYL